jgi:glycosyltransferase involved in cell wall biosynthesis
MNILIASTNSVFSNSHYGGAETSLAVIAEELCNKGENVFYYTTARNYLPFKRKFNHEGLTVIQDSFFRWPGKVFKRLKHRWIEKQQIQSLKHIISTNEIDLCYCFGRIVHSILPLKSEFPNLKCVLRIAGTTVNTDTKWDQTYFDQLFNRVDALNFQSIDHKNVYIANLNQAEVEYKNNSKELVFDIGIHPSYFKLQKIPSLPFRMLCIMRFSARKRQDIVIKALRKLPLDIEYSIYLLVMVLTSKR